MEENEFLIDLYDEDGNKTVFEHLDTIKLNDKEYIICIPYDESQEDVNEIVIMEVCKDEKGEDALRQVDDMTVLNSVYTEFRARNEDKFEFTD